MNEHEPPPKSNDNPTMWDLVLADMRERDQVGEQRYGTRLQPFNGRNALVDAYQEALDLVVYLRQEVAEAEELRKHTAEMERQRDRAVMLREQTAAKLEQVRRWWLNATMRDREVDGLEWPDPTTCEGHGWMVPCVCPAWDEGEACG
jgi:hypothetical protein